MLFVDELRRAVVAGYFGPNTYRLAEVDKKFTGPFSWDEAVKSEAPALVYRQACNDVAGCRAIKTCLKIPDTCMLC
ncbi:hypothetical protein JG688_00010969 [Phytophthora aleatoria]|uniref:Uncharacterized protein n=1 Tax=Phytophthora aleatoria TaxID=2496075 RepID=A0A8J5M5K8_9STRA|nr:hypothetical protein JG688_00010969 [Phytophthora aleatoria]